MDSPTPTTTRRASPLGLEQRQDMIIGVVIPLLLEHGPSLTSRQIAEAAGIAEGTIFRAFGDKETLVSAAVARYLDPLALHAALRSIDPEFSLDDKLRAIIGLLRDRFGGIIRMMSVMGEGPPQRRGGTEQFESIISEILQPHAAELAVEPAIIAQFVRVIAFALAIPTFGESIPLTPDEIVALVKHGVALPKES